MDLFFVTERHATFGSGVRPLVLILGLVCFPLSSSLNAQLRAQDVKPLLEGYEWRLAPEPFICMGKGVDAALRAVASDETLPYYYRQRALTTLSLFPNRDTANYLEQVISDSASHPSHVQRALFAYANAYAGKQPGRVTEVARNALTLSSDHQIRFAAAETLARLRTTGAKQTLRDYMHSGLSTLQRQQLRHMMRQSKSVQASSRGRRSGAVSHKQSTCAQNAQ
jgi:hypothetical protein